VIEASEVLVIERGEDGLGKRDGTRFDRIARELAPLDHNFRKDVEGVLGKFSGAVFEMSFDERVVNLVQGAREFFAVASAPLAATDRSHDFALSERNLLLDWSAVIRVLLDERDKDFVRELPRLPVFGIGSDDHVLVGRSPVELDLLRAARCAFGIMTEECARHAKQRVLYVELFNWLWRLTAMCRLHAVGEL
jgi:hypothetical protein